MSVAIPSSITSPQGKHRVLLISGVDISSSKPSSLHENPMPDYRVLINEFHPDVIDIRSIQNSKHPMMRFARKRLNYAWAIAWLALVRARKYQTVVATGEDVGLRLAVLFKLFGVRVPLIMTCHNIATRRPLFFLQKLRAATSVHTFQCLSQTQAQMLSEYAQVSPRKIQMLYWHVDHNFFQPIPEVASRNQIASAGMASRDYATLINAVSGLDVDLKIAADSPWFKQSLNIEDDRLPECVEVRSYGTYSALRQLYAESLFVVVPLLDVPFSAGYTVILEAMSMGKAVVVSRITQQDDFIVDGWNGLYVTPGDADELRERICFLVNNPDEARRLGENGRRTIEERFTLDHYQRRMQEAIEQAL